MTNPYESPFAETYHLPAKAAPRHSGLGITSFVMSILVGLGIFASIVVAGVMSSTSEIKDDSVEAIALGLTIFGLLALDLIALAFGIAGVCQSQRHKVFAILGILFSLAVAGGTVGLIILGIALGA